MDMNPYGLLALRLAVCIAASVAVYATLGGVVAVFTIPLWGVLLADNPGRHGTKKPKGLGMGLEALLGPKVSDPHRRRRARPAAKPPAGAGRSAAVRQVPAAHPHGRGLALRAGREHPQPGRDAAHPGASGGRASGYEIIAGERRFRAARWPGWTRCRCWCKEVPDEAAAVMALIENIQREDLNPLEEAQGLQRLVAEFGLTHEQAAQAVGRSRSAASNLLRLLNLAEPVQQMLMAGDLDMGHARALLALESAAQITGANEIAARKLSRCARPKAGRAHAGRPADSAAARQAGKPRDIARLEEQLADLLTAAGRDPHPRQRVAANRARSRSVSARSTNSTACSA
jgi:ParB family chromosome partitioning protein